MDLDAVILADAVSAPPDGKVYVQGGGISRYEIPQLPWPLPLGVWIRLKVSDGDFGQPHEIGVALIGPAGIPNIPPMLAHAAPPAEPPDHLVEGEEEFVNLALQLPAVAVLAGLYRLEIHIDGELARSVALPVVLSEDGNGHSVVREWPQ